MVFEGTLFNIYNDVISSYFCAINCFVNNNSPCVRNNNETHIYTTHRKTTNTKTGSGRNVVPR